MLRVASSLSYILAHREYQLRIQIHHLLEQNLVSQLQERLLQTGPAQLF